MRGSKHGEVGGAKGGLDVPSGNAASGECARGILRLGFALLLSSSSDASGSKTLTPVTVTGRPNKGLTGDTLSA